MRSTDRLPPRSKDVDVLVRQARLRYHRESRSTAAKIVELLQEIVIPLGKKLGLAVLAACRNLVMLRKSPAVRDFSKRARLSNLAADDYLKATLRVVRRSVIRALMVGGAETRPVLVAMSRKAALLPSLRFGSQWGRATTSSAVAGIQSRISEDPTFPLKILIVIVGFALSIVCGLVLPGVLGIVPPAK